MFKKLFIFFVFLALIVGVSAAVLPLPNAYYGTVKIGGSSAPAGTEIVAKVFGTNHGQITTTQLGKYGGTGSYDPKLEVVLTEEEYSGCCYSCNGCTLLIEFYINGKKADQTSTFEPGGFKELNLTVSGVAPPTTSPTTTRTTAPTGVPTTVATTTVTTRPTSIPALPHSFYGTAVLQGGTPAPTGAEIRAMASGVIYGEGNPVIIVTPGVYGGTGLNDRKLEVQGYIETGIPLQFYIGGSLAECNDGSGWTQSYPYTQGAITALDLRTNVTGPIANFVAQPVNGYEALMVQFTDLSSGPPTSWHWEFGDGTTADIQNPVHRYYNGKYTITLTVSNAAGFDTLTQTDYITVYRQSSPGGGGGGGGGGYYAVSGGTTPTATPTTTPTPTPTVTTVSVIPGGTLPLNSGLALSQSVTIASQDNTGFIFMVAGMRPTTTLGEPLLTLSIRRISDSDVPPVPAGALFSYAGYAYEIEPSGAAFDPYVTLTITVSEQDWAVIRDRELFLKWYNPGTSAWEDLPSTVDPVARTVSAKITHTSVFALFASLPPTIAQTPVPTTAPVTPSGFNGILTYLWILIIAVIIVVAVMIVIFILKRRGEPEEEMTEEESWKME